jgi:DNA-dependent protein kinase catalytic subunit
MSVVLVENFLDELTKYIAYPPQEGKDAAAVAQDLAGVVLNDITSEEMRTQKFLSHPLPLEFATGKLFPPRDASLRFPHQQRSQLFSPFLRQCSFHDPTTKINVSDMNLYGNFPALVASLLFKSEEKNVLHFLRNTMELPKHKELAACRAEVVDLVDKMVALLGAKSISEYANAIREGCYWVFRREQSAKVKATSLDPIVSLVELNLSRFDAESLQIKEMSDGMVKEYASSKTSATVKSAILQTLGIFSEFFPTEMKDRVSMLVPAILDDLQNQFKSSKKPDQKLIAGGIRGLASILVHFSSQLTTDEQKMQRTHTCAIVCGLEMPEGVRTFDTLKASLAFVARHASLFKRYLTQEYQKIYLKLKSYCSHGNRAVRRAAFPALDAFLTEVAGEIGSNQQRSYEANIAAFKYFMNEFFQGFDSNAAGIYEISVAIRGFGKFAKVTRRMMGVAQVKNMLDKLVGFSDRFYSGAALSVGGEGLEDAVSHLPNFITAFANIFLELDVSTSSEDSEATAKGAVSLMTYVDHLERLIGAFFISYPQMYDHQRYPNYIALARLFASLYLKGPMALRVLLTRVMFQGLTLTCSKPIEIPNGTMSRRFYRLDQSLIFFISLFLAREQATTSTENYFEYQDLWKNLLSPRIPEDILTQEAFGAEQSKQLQTIIFDQFIESLIKVQQKLSLDYIIVKVTEKGVEKPLSAFSPDGKKIPPPASVSAQNAQPQTEEDDDPEVEDRVKPSVPKDFELFLSSSYRPNVAKSTK